VWKLHVATVVLGEDNSATTRSKQRRLSSKGFLSTLDHASICSGGLPIARYNALLDGFVSTPSDLHTCSIQRVDRTPHVL
jgi:hypothetical protein